MKFSTPTMILFACIATYGCDRQQPVATSTTSPAAATATAPANAEPHYEATLAQGIDFRRVGLPTFVRDIAGLSGQEDWGRWSDANLAPSVKIHLANPLSKNITLELTARGVFENTNLPTRVLIGGIEKTFTLGEKDNTYTLKFDLSAPAQEIEIIPPSPRSAKDAGISQDTRRLGVGLSKLKIHAS